MCLDQMILLIYISTYNHAFSAGWIYEEYGKKCCWLPLVYYFYKMTLPYIQRYLKSPDTWPVVSNSIFTDLYGVNLEVITSALKSQAFKAIYVLPGVGNSIFLI
jgi:hypothetical protein